ncbi:hypothetical protein QTQ03_28025 [Micromonospora sp. WMMA1363]|nr:hypothetical protein [Micromonospora sp. WMMA1363]MDM4723257.1 hypothetical protein [Micromonospora sp. WMMA1363]
MMRGKDPNAKSVFKVDVDPSQFPPLPGYGYLIDRIRRPVGAVPQLLREQ